MKRMINDLRDAKKDLKILGQKTEKMIRQLEKLEKPQVAKRPKTKAARKAVARKPAKLSASETVLAIIKRGRKGVDKATLVNKTGFKDSNIHTILYRLTKQGKIKSERKGIYVKA